MQQICVEMHALFRWLVGDNDDDDDDDDDGDGCWPPQECELYLRMSLIPSTGLGPETRDQTKHGKRYWWNVIGETLLVKRSDSNVIMQSRRGIQSW